MSLLHRENSPSLAEMPNVDPSQYSGDAAAPKSNPSNVQECDGWRLEQPHSPEATQSPGTLVPAPCFPPRGDPAAFTSFSELAHPGGCSSEPHQGLADLVESFRALGATPRPQNSGAPARSHSMLTSPNCKIPFLWQPESALGQQQDGRALTRPASSCGAVERGRGLLLSWSGILPPRCTDDNPPGGFSPKVFLGGLPWDFPKEAFLVALREFEPVCMDWPGQHKTPRGFAYVTLKSERHVRALLHASCRYGTKWIYSLDMSWGRTKDVQVIPWAVTDSNWVSGVDVGRPFKIRLDPSHTVFVGALHGIISASALARIMDDLFSDVLYAGIDIDKTKYPIGSGRVTFGNKRSYMRAVSAHHVVIRTAKLTKEIHVDPYLEDSMCSICNLLQGPYFCREPVCLRYFCRSCWAWQHPSHNHQALMLNCKRVTLINENDNSNGNSSSNGNGSSNGQPQPAVDMWGGFTQTLATPPPEHELVVSGGRRLAPGAGQGDLTAERPTARTAN